MFFLGEISVNGCVRKLLIIETHFQMCCYFYWKIVVIKPNTECIESICRKRGRRPTVLIRSLVMVVRIGTVVSRKSSAYITTVDTGSQHHRGSLNTFLHGKLSALIHITRSSSKPTEVTITSFDFTWRQFLFNPERNSWPKKGFRPLQLGEPMSLLRWKSVSGVLVGFLLLF